jgi:phosphatidylserine/phosphatidylglycerophosphate/cardiolipin synthase-like enzyme
MRFVSRKAAGYRLYAVTGTNTVSFAIDFSEADTGGLLGFAVERHDPAENERYFMHGFKVFESIIPHPDDSIHVSTYEHPIQSFVWDDFTAKPERKYTYSFHPLKGTPKNIDRSPTPLRIDVETEPLFSTLEHDIFFNRGVASSQAYARRFDNKPPSELLGEAKRRDALQWLSRELDDAILAFIDSAAAGDTLLGCFYEFRYLPVAERLKTAIDRGVEVRLVLDAKRNATIDANGTVAESFPREENKRTVEAAKLPARAIACWRENNRNDIQHNKFMVLLRGSAAIPAEVWTGSTNLSIGGIHGQTNVGHRVRNGGVAAAYRDYWELLATDPGAVEGEPRRISNAKRKAYREAVMALGEIPQTWRDIPQGVSTIFSPRIGSEVLDLYVGTLDGADTFAAITLAFGIGKQFKAALVDNTSTSPVTFLLLEKRDERNPRAKGPFVPLTTANNAYQAWGAFLRDRLYRWVRETNPASLGLNRHVAYVHSKFLLKDPLGADPIVITGSANFSEASIDDNDENMLLVRGDRRVADIYFTEFNRLFNHYYFRSVQESLRDRRPPDGNAAADTTASLFLDETPGWLEKYKPGTLRRKRVEIFAGMARSR